MIVVDSSAIIDYLLVFEPRAAWVSDRLEDADTLHAPHILDVEVANVLRKLVLRGELSPERGLSALRILPELDLRRYPHADLLERMWELRETVHSADAAFVALAEALDAPLVTTDSRLAGAPGVHARVDAFPG